MYNFRLLQKANDLANEITEFPLGKCGPSDDSDKQSAYVFAFMDIVKHFLGVLKRLDDPEINRFLSGLNFDPEWITEAYTLKADLQIVIDIIHERFEEQKEMKEIPSAFISYACEILGDTNEGFTGGEIIRRCVEFAVNYDVDIPYTKYPFPKTVPNKRTALLRNLEAFDSVQQYIIILKLCEYPKFEDVEKIKELKIKLFSNYHHLYEDEELHGIDSSLVEATRHWLMQYPSSYKLYSDGISKYKSKIFQRNLLDDLRLSLESLCKEILGNKKSLENQIAPIGEFLINKKVSTELRNMYAKLIDYYTKYNNNYIKHDDAVKEQDIELIIELTSSFMKYIVRIANE